MGLLNKLFSGKLRAKEIIPMNMSQVSVIFGQGKSRHRPRNDKKLYDGAYPFI